MIEDWRKRLAETIEAKGFSKRAVFLAAGRGQRYVSSLLNEEKTPSIESLAAVCKILGVSTSYILLGAKISAEQEELVSLFEKAHPDDRQAVLTLLRPRKRGGSH